MRPEGIIQISKDIKQNSTLPVPAWIYVWQRTAVDSHWHSWCTSVQSCCGEKEMSHVSKLEDISVCIMWQLNDTYLITLFKLKSLQHVVNQIHEHIWYIYIIYIYIFQRLWFIINKMLFIWFSFTIPSEMILKSRST